MCVCSSWIENALTYAGNNSPCSAFQENRRATHPVSARRPCCFSDSNGRTGNSLADTSTITLNGAPPQPISVSLATGTPDAATYGLGEVIRLAVTFDKSVTVVGDSPPVLVLACTRAREALFDGSGNGSTTLFFEYEVCSFWPLRPSPPILTNTVTTDSLTVPRAPYSGPKKKVTTSYRTNFPLLARHEPEQQLVGMRNQQLGATPIWLCAKEQPVLELLTCSLLFRVVTVT